MPSFIKGRESGTYFKGYIEGGPALARKLAQLEKGVRDELLKEVTQEGGEVIAKEWRARVPIDDRDYQNSIEVRSRAGKNGATAIVGTGTVEGLEQSQQPRNYAPKLEFGSSSQPAQPSLRPAFDATRGRALDAMGKKVWQLIEKAV